MEKYKPSVHTITDKPRKKPFTFLASLIVLGIIMLGMVITSPRRKRRYSV